MKPRWWIVSAIQDTRLSADARALLVFLGTRPGGWRYNVEECRRYLKFGRQKFQKILREAKAAGCVEIEQRHDKRGRLKFAVMRLADTPRAENHPSETARPRDDLKASGPRAENHPSRARVMRAGARSLATGSTQETLRVIQGGRQADGPGFAEKKGATK